MIEPTIEELLNKVALLKESLVFYGDKDNYIGETTILGYETPISRDNGHLARFAIEQVKKIDNYITRIREEYEDTVEKNEEIIKLINELKNIK